MLLEFILMLPLLLIVVLLVVDDTLAFEVFTYDLLHVVDVLVVVTIRLDVVDVLVVVIATVDVVVQEAPIM